MLYILGDGLSLTSLLEWTHPSCLSLMLGLRNGVNLG